MKTETLYQLVARGPRKHFDSAGTISSRRVYRTRQAAMDAIAEFTVKCCGYGLSDLDQATVKVDVAELIVDEWRQPAEE